MKKEEFIRFYSQLGSAERHAARALLKERGINFYRLPITKKPACLDRPALSFAQQRLWFLSQLEAEAATYNMVGAARITGPLSIPTMERSLNEIVRRHDILRTTFPTVDNLPVQVVAAELTIPLPAESLADRDEQERAARIAQRLREEETRPFDLSTGPLIRACALQLDAQEHVLVISMHHIVSDEWSIGILIHEIATLYDALWRDQPPALPALSIQYSDFAHWQRDWYQDEVLPEQLAYWQQQLQDAPALLELPADRPRPAVCSRRGATVQFTFPDHLSQALQQLGRAADATLFMVLLAAFNVLLARHSGQSDLSIGTPIANRSRPEVGPLIGLFVNTIVLRTQVNPTARFRDLLARVRDTALDAYAHQDVPFERVVDALSAPRNLSHSPLFQVAFVMPEEIAPLPVAGLTFHPLRVDSQLAKFDLTLRMINDRGRMHGSFEFSTDLYERAAIERMATQFMVLCQAIADHPDALVADLPLLSESERARVLAHGAASACYPRAGTLQQLFEAQVARTPHHTAVVDDGKRLSYAELNARANQVAHQLRTLGAGPDTLVGLCMDRSVELLVALVGIVKAGGAYLPLDPAYPVNRLTYMLDDARPAAVLTHSSLQHLFVGTDRPVFCIDTEAPALAAQSADNPEPVTHDDHLAYVIYTSGSTGKPKGSAMTHRNVTRLFAATHERFAFNEQDVWTLFHSFAFDFSVWEIWGALLCGGKLVIVPHLVSRAPELFYDLLLRERVTILNQTPSAFQQLSAVCLAQPSSAGLALRKVIFGGEALHPATLAPWFERYGAASPLMINMYGITETTVHVTYFELDGHSACGSRIGRPLPDLQAYVLDATGNPQPVGVPGELHIGGDGLARGYLNRPELTAERFIPNPFGQPGSRLYKTGDLARYEADGNIEYLGRIDHQVKIRGFRIELGEIEAALMQVPGVAEVLVVAREDAANRKQLVAYVVPSRSSRPEPGLFRSALLHSLPDYMVPAFYVVLDQFPLTANGKVDRAALPPPVPAASAAIHVPPQTPTEKTLARLWGEVLNVQAVGLHDDFFELGGDSMLIAQLASRIRAAFGIDLPLSVAYVAPTIADIAPHVDAALREADTVQAQQEDIFAQAGDFIAKLKETTQ